MLPVRSIFIELSASNEQFGRRLVSLTLDFHSPGCPLVVDSVAGGHNVGLDRTVGGVRCEAAGHDPFKESAVFIKNQQFSAE